MTDEQCPCCNGSGMGESPRMPGKTAVYAIAVQCVKCQGTGYIPGSSACSQAEYEAWAECPRCEEKAICEHHVHFKVEWIPRTWQTIAVIMLFAWVVFRGIVNAS